MSNLLDEFLSAPSHSRGGGSTRIIKKWHDDLTLDMWLHKHSSILKVWRHGLPREVTFTKDGSDELHFWGGNWVCLENENVLSKQYNVDKKTGERDVPPQRCPICLLNEWIVQQLVTGKMHWLQPILEFKGSSLDRKGNTSDKVFHAALMVGRAPRNPSDTEKQEARRVKVFLNDAFKEAIQAKPNHIFRVVRHSEVEKGIQILDDGALVGEKVKMLILHTMKEFEMSKGDSTLGNPLVNPYLIRLTFDEKSKLLSDRVTAHAMASVTPTQDILDALDEQEDVPSIDELIKPLDVDAVRAIFETYAAPGVAIPWDSFFKPNAETSYATPPKREAPAAKPAPAPAKPAVRRTVVEQPAVAMSPCEACGKPMRDDATKCPHCGTTYELMEDEPTKGVNGNVAAMLGGDEIPF